jgi:hypothetical protein
MSGASATRLQRQGLGPSQGLLGAGASAFKAAPNKAGHLVPTHWAPEWAHDVDADLPLEGAIQRTMQKLQCLVLPGLRGHTLWGAQHTQQPHSSGSA